MTTRLDGSPSYCVGSVAEFMQPGRVFTGCVSHLSHGCDKILTKGELILACGLRSSPSLRGRHGHRSMRWLTLEPPSRSREMDSGAGFLSSFY